MSETHSIVPPIANGQVERFHAGDIVLISGEIFTARDSAHKRLVALAKAGEVLPLDLNGAVLYYVGPTPAPPGRPIGSAGPTTSSRMDPYTEDILSLGVRLLIGKGSRSQSVKDAFLKHKAIYCAAVGGAGALISQKLLSAKVVAFEELGPEAIHLLTVKDFPCIVVNDIYGRDLYETGVQAYRRL